VSHVLSDPRCERFSVPWIDGVIPYRRGLRCLVAVGDPVCEERHAGELAECFRAACARRGWSTVFAAAGDGFAESCVARGYAAVEFGQEQIFDPRRDASAGAQGRELRKKLKRALRDGVTPREYFPDGVGDAALEAVGRAWLAARRGLQVFVSPFLPFAELSGRRWFYAERAGGFVGVLTLVRLDRRDGWLIEHLLAHPRAPLGTTELLVSHAFAALAAEGCGHVTFGPAVLPALGRMRGLARTSAAVGRAVFNGASRVLHLDSLSRYRKKFQPFRVEASHLLFHPPRIGLYEVTGLLRAFNVSLKSR
jgi:lysylphosphatidylglycerol synthetase-like protein (DUF2156 family)